MSLRKCLLVISIALILWTAGLSDEYIVDNDDGPPGFHSYGKWTLSGTTGYNGGTYIYSRSDEAPSSATWTANILTPGKYELSYMFRNGGNRSTAAPFTITHADGTDVVYLNMAGGGTMTELPLGEFRFDAGTSGAVRLDNSGPPTVFIADAVRFITAVDAPPEITDVSRMPQYPKDTDEVTVTADITDDNEVTSAILHYSSTPAGSSWDTAMFDDGAHGDGAAGDDVFGGAIPPQPDGDQVEYFVSAVDNLEQWTTGTVYSYIVGEEAPREYRSLWADSWNRSFLNPSEAEEIVNTCREYNINTIMIEVRKVGDASYKSHIEPRATNISGGSEYDPLGYLLELAHDTSLGKKYIEVHAWFVMHRITTGESLDTSHVLVQHPEYTMLDSTGSSGGSTKFIDPGHPGTVDHNVAVILDCLEHYDIDGINMDYIRYPEAAGSWGYNPVSVARFNAFYNKTGQPATSDPDWADWRRQCVTLEVKKIYVKSLMKNPGVVVTADTVNWGYDYDNYAASSAYAAVFQDWVGWLEQGIMDYNALMDYSTNTGRYQGWANLSLAHDDKRGSIIGIGAYLQSSVQNSMDQLAWARAQGAAGLNIYDWYSEASGAGGETRTKFYTELKSQLYPAWADPPEHMWKTHPTVGIFEGNLTYKGSPVDHGTVMIEGQSSTQTYTDGSGWYGIMEVPPGSHMLRFSKTGYDDVVTSATIPSPGDIVTVNVDLFRFRTGWMNY
jgi:uncharacterized lipoprotein YddW (UPF0748 family)